MEYSRLETDASRWWSGAPGRIGRLISGVALFAGGTVGLGACISYSRADPSWNTATSEPVSNLFGLAGAVFADLAIQTFGIGIFAICAGLIIGGMMRAIGIGPRRPWRWLWGAGASLTGCVALAALSPPDTFLIGTGAGGLVGQWGGAASTNLLQVLTVPAAAVVAPLLAALLCGLAVTATIGIGPVWRAVGAIRTAGGHVSGWGVVAVVFVARCGRLLFRLVGGYRRESGPLAQADVLASSLPIPATSAEPTRKKNRKPRSKKQKQPPGDDTGAVANSFVLPSIDLLRLAPRQARDIDEAALLETARVLQGVLKDFNVDGRIKEVRPGPVVTLFEMEPAPGVKSARVIGLAADIARSMSATSARLSVIAGRNAIGIELPNQNRQTVYLRSLLSSATFRGSEAALPMALGATIGGEPVVADLAKMPHLLIAGTTGSGKSVGVNAMILSLMYHLPPERCRFIMIDPKMLELSIYEDVPHLLSPVVIDPHKAVVALKWVVREMENRYELMSRLGVRNIGGFNAKVEKACLSGKSLTRPVRTGTDEITGEVVWETREIPPEPMPHIVVVIDEMADLMITAGKDVESLIQRIAQMARAAGIHVITATQRPSVDVITGTIKANFPTRISYMVTTKIDSRTIIGEQGAEQLLGMGDLLYMASGGKIQRLHGPFVADDEVSEVVAHLKGQGGAQYVSGVTEEPPDEPPEASGPPEAGSGEGDLYQSAVQVVTRDRRASTSYIQRRLKIGYNRAASLIERMEEEGVVSPPNHAGKREILIDQE